jgi:hypothetical protein
MTIAYWLLPAQKNERSPPLFLSVKRSAIALPHPLHSNSHQKLRGNYVFSKHPATNQKTPTPFYKRVSIAPSTPRDRP